MRRLLLFLHMLDHRPSRFRASEQNAAPEVVAGPVIEHAVLNSNRDQFVHVEIPTNGKIVVSDIPIFLVHKNQLLASFS
jgi:hypothetical protein